MRGQDRSIGEFEFTSFALGWLVKGVAEAGLFALQISKTCRLLAFGMNFSPASSLGSTFSVVPVQSVLCSNAASVPERRLLLLQDGRPHVCGCGSHVLRLLRLRGHGGGLSDSARAAVAPAVPEGYGQLQLPHHCLGADSGHFSRGLASAQFCAGFEGEACVFALAKSGGPAQVHQRQARSCLFCDPVAVGSKVDAPGGLKDIAAALKKMSEAARARALTERIPEDVRARVQALLIPKEPRRPRLGAPPELAELQRRWAPALAERQSAATAAQKKAYRERVLADKARGRKHAGRPKERTVPGAAVDNSAPAPPAKRSAKAAGLERWALHYSWAQCEACGAMLARDLTQKSLTRDQKVTAPSLQCPRCRGARGHPAPKLADVPEPLRGLSEEAAQTLSPLEVDVGFEQRAKHGTGYRVHAHMLRLRWKEAKVRAAIRELEDDEMRRKTKVAYDYLRQAEDSAYGKFLREHKSFLEEHPEADRTARRRRLAFLERPGLECALWPTLFWRQDMTFSHERASDPRRQKAETLEAALRPARPDDDESGDEGEAEDSDLVRHSIKRLYAALSLGQLLGYTDHYEILQYVYDLHLWTDLGSKRNLGTGVPMRLMLAGSTFSPIYCGAWLTLCGKLGSPSSSTRCPHQSGPCPTTAMCLTGWPSFCAGGCAFQSRRHSTSSTSCCRRQKAFS